MEHIPENTQKHIDNLVKTINKLNKERNKLEADNKALSEQLILSGVVKSLPDGDDIWCKANEMSRDNFADWYDNL